MKRRQNACVLYGFVRMEFRRTGEGKGGKCGIAAAANGGDGGRPEHVVYDKNVTTAHQTENVRSLSLCYVGIRCLLPSSFHSG